MSFPEIHEARNVDTHLGGEGDEAAPWWMSVLLSPVHLVEYAVKWLEYMSASATGRIVLLVVINLLLLVIIVALYKRLRRTSSF